MCAASSSRRARLRLWAREAVPLQALEPLCKVPNYVKLNRQLPLLHNELPTALGVSLHIIFCSVPFNLDQCPVTIQSRETCVSHYGKEVTNMEDVGIRDLVAGISRNWPDWVTAEARSKTTKSSADN